MYSRSVVISVLVHVLVLAAAIIAPITASDVLPAIHNPMRPYLRAFRPADIVLPQPATNVPPTVRRNAGPPIVAPFGIAPEQPRVPPTVGIEVEGAVEGLTEPGVPAGFDTGGTVVLPPPPPPTPVHPTAPVPVGGRIKAPIRVAYAPPIYPTIAQNAHVQGDVMIQAIIGVDGSVQNLRLLRGHLLLNDAALDAVSRWRYTPTLLNGVAVPVVMTVTVSFQLR